MKAEEATKVLARLRTAENALQAARLVTQDLAMQARIGNLQTQARQLIQWCEWELQHTGPEAA